MRFYLNKIVSFGVFHIDHQGKCLAQNENKKYKRSACTYIFVKMCFSRSRTIRMSDSDFFSMSSSRKMSISKLSSEMFDSSIFV